MTIAQKVVLCGAGFLGSNIATAISNANNSAALLRRVQISSRNPYNVYTKLKETLPEDHLLPPVPVDVTNRETLAQAFKNADVVVSLVGILHGSPAQFEAIQWKGAENVARAAAAVGAKLIHISAIGADLHGKIPYVRTKALGEEAVRSHCANATIIRPSLVFGPGDEVCTAFSLLACASCFWKGRHAVSAVYVGDIGLLVEILTRCSPGKVADGKIIEAAGPDVLTFRQIMQLVVDHTGRFRPIISVPWILGELQGEVMQRLPINLFTITRDQIEQLKLDNVATFPIPHTHVDFKGIMEAHSCTLTSVYDVLPHYLK
ncbi:NAD-P-binding protein [Russula aff. rugulosa BPL654]|nr:NAD-P-binding protein [Russula aff. rugulosa BPL654]